MIGNHLQPVRKIYKVLKQHEKTRFRCRFSKICLEIMMRGNLYPEVSQTSEEEL